MPPTPRQSLSGKSNNLPIKSNNPAQSSDRILTNVQNDKFKPNQQETASEAANSGPFIFQFILLKIFISHFLGSQRGPVNSRAGTNGAYQGPGNISNPMMSSYGMSGYGMNSYGGMGGYGMSGYGGMGGYGGMSGYGMQNSPLLGAIYTINQSVMALGQLVNIIGMNSQHFYGMITNFINMIKPIILYSQNTGKKYKHIIP